MDFRILGPVEVQDQRTGLRIVPVGTKQRALLGAFVARAGKALSHGRLTDELWGEHPPANAANALQAHVMRLRRRLAVPPPGPGEPRHEWIVTRTLGYSLCLGTARTDAVEFTALAERGRALCEPAPDRSIALLRQALALWRGSALEGAGRGGICAAEAAQLEECRLSALETLYDACLRAHRHAGIIAELQELTSEHPLRERFYDLLMVALYRSGRQGEALGVYDRARRRLVRDLGVEPGPALRSRMEAILHHDTHLQGDPAGGPVATVHRLPGPAEEPYAPAWGVDADRVLMLCRQVDRLTDEVERLTFEHHQLLQHLTRQDRRAVAARSRQDSSGVANAVFAARPLTIP